MKNYIMDGNYFLDVLSKALTQKHLQKPIHSCVEDVRSISFTISAIIFAKMDDVLKL